MNRLLSVFVIAAFMALFPAPLPAHAAADDGSIIGPDDILMIHVADHPELGAEKVIVSRSGSVTHPVWGEVRADGLTAKQLETAIAEHLAADFVAEPHVAVGILQANRTLVYLLATSSGSSTSTNVYRLAINGKLSELVILSGATSEFCKQMLITIMRKEARLERSGDGQQALTGTAGPEGPPPGEATAPNLQPQAPALAPQAPAEAVVQATIDLYDLMVLGRKQLDVPLKRDDSLQFTRRNPNRNRGYTFVLEQDAGGHALFNATDRPPAAPARETRFALEPDELVIIGDFPPAGQNQVSVFGEVDTKGSVELTADMTVGKLVAKAVLAPKAGSLSRIVLVQRTNSPQGRTTKADVFYMMNSSPEDGYGITKRLQSGDMVFVIGDRME